MRRGGCGCGCGCGCGEGRERERALAKRDVHTHKHAPARTHRSWWKQTRHICVETRPTTSSLIRSLRTPRAEEGGEERRHRDLMSQLETRKRRAETQNLRMWLRLCDVSLSSWGFHRIKWRSRRQRTPHASSNSTFLPGTLINPEVQHPISTLDTSSVLHSAPCSFHRACAETSAISLSLPLCLSLCSPAPITNVRVGEGG